MGALSISRSPLLSIAWPFSQLLDPFSDRTHHRNRPLSGTSGKRFGLDAWDEGDDLPPFIMGALIRGYLYSFFQP